jgi:hypothetical protein
MTSKYVCRQENIDELGKEKVIAWKGDAACCVSGPCDESLL